MLKHHSIFSWPRRYNLQHVVVLYTTTLTNENTRCGVTTLTQSAPRITIVCKTIGTTSCSRFHYYYYYSIEHGKVRERTVLIANFFQVLVSATNLFLIDWFKHCENESYISTDVPEAYSSVATPKFYAHVCFFIICSALSCDNTHIMIPYDSVWRLMEEKQIYRYHRIMVQDFHFLRKNYLKNGRLHNKTK